MVFRWHCSVLMTIGNRDSHGSSTNESQGQLLARPLPLLTPFLDKDTHWALQSKKY